MRRPVCTPCKVEFKCVENGVEVVDYGPHGPVAIAEADEVECPNCRHRIIVGFGVPEKGDLQALTGAVQRATDAGWKRDNVLDTF